jgi:acyl-CoA reductase-like NAD-dependent aldehyde dehydrogenase
MSTHQSYLLVNPYTGKTQEEETWSTVADINSAIAKLAVSKKSIFHRAEILKTLASLLEEKKQEFALQIAREMGKAFKDGIIEIDRSVCAILACAAELQALKGESLSSDSYLPSGVKPSQKIVLVERFPLGVVLAISPFNFPVNLIIHKLAPSYAMGNATLVKPHPQCIHSAKLLVKTCYEAGFLESDLQLINPAAKEMEYLIAHEQIQALSFTGGVETAKKISKNAGLKKQLYELGGNDALVIYPDADLAKAVDTLLVQRFRCSGQRCTSPKRIYLHQNIYESFKTLLLEKVTALQVGDPESPNTDVGPVFSEIAREQIMLVLEKFKAENAVVLCGGINKGNIIFPTVIEKLSPYSPNVLEEVFGPIAPLFSFEDTHDVIKMINSSKYGLQCGVFTQNISVLKTFFQEVHVGSVIANEGPAYRMDHFPFGGNGLSGVGREGVGYTMKELSVLKSLVL